MGKTSRLTAITVLFIRHVSTIIVSITDPSCWDTATCVSALELVLTTRCTITDSRYPVLRATARLLAQVEIKILV